MIVIYHQSCNDGFCAAWLLSKVYPDAEFIPYQYGEMTDELIEICSNQQIIIADFSFKREIMELIDDVATNLQCYDHHESAKDELVGLPYCTFDMNKSGAHLVFDFLWKDYVDIRTVGIFDTSFRYVARLFVNYTEDRDLWKWKLPYSREFSAALFSYPRTFETWDLIAEMVKAEDPAAITRDNPLITEGTAILRYQHQQATALASKSTHHQLTDRNKQTSIPLVNSSTLQSEIGEILANRSNIGGTFMIVTSYQENPKVVVSLRSNNNGLALKIAKANGGGGHPDAAGFSTNIERFFRG